LKKKIIIGITALALVLGTLVLLQDPEEKTTDNTELPPLPTEINPVYVTFVGHIEDNDIYLDCKVYEDRKQDLLDVAEIIKAGNATFNLQIEYQFFQGAQNCEGEEENTIDYLATEYGFEIDAHQEGAWDWVGDDNYADIRHLGELITPHITETAGLVWNYALQFPELDAGQRGQIYPEFTWSPEILSGAVGYKHHLGDFNDDDLSSGIWIPKGTNDDFYIHDPDNRMVYVAGGPHGNWEGTNNCTFQNAADYAETLVNYMQDGTVDNTKIFTAAMTLPQTIMFNQKEKITELLEQLEPLVEAGYVKYVTYTELVDIWRTKFNSEPNIFKFNEIDPADYTCNQSSLSPIIRSISEPSIS